MRHALLALGVAAGFAGNAFADPLAGYDRLAVKAPHRADLVAASVWYPVGTPTHQGLIGDYPAFKGTRAYVGAAIADGRFPLVVLSHGSGGNMDGLSWLSSALALRGAMVLAVNHPGSTSGDSSPRRSILLHERARDLSVALDHLLGDATFASHVEEDHVVALGFSLGGTTALNLAGARMDRDAYQAFCERLGDDAPDCAFFAKGGVDLANLPAAWEGDLRDPRIGAVIAVDPGLTYGFRQNSIAAFNLPVQLINLGEQDRWQAVDVDSRGSKLTEKLPEVDYVVVDPANHFSFLGLCKPEGPALLDAERDDPVCDDPEGSDRSKVHAEIIEHMVRFLGL
ncbi:MAG: alpha/beta hydrolase family protein [Geminicoccaceae bacterium]